MRKFGYEQVKHVLYKKSCSSVTILYEIITTLSKIPTESFLNISGPEFVLINSKIFFLSKADKALKI